ELDLALRLSERALRLSDSPELRDTLGFVRWRRGELEAARREFETVLAERPEHPAALYHLALVQAGAGDRAAARSSLQRALAAGAFGEGGDRRAALPGLSAP